MGVATSTDMKPDALVGASEPTVKRLEMEGARFYTEVRGSGDPLKSAYEQALSVNR